MNKVLKGLLFFLVSAIMAAGTRAFFHRMGPSSVPIEIIVVPLLSFVLGLIVFKDWWLTSLGVIIGPIVCMVIIYVAKPKVLNIVPFMLFSMTNLFPIVAGFSGYLVRRAVRFLSNFSTEHRES